MNTKNEKQYDREKYQAQKVQMTFDQMIKNILDHIEDRNIIAFINSMLGISLDKNSKVEKLQTETHIEGDRKTADFFYRINKTLFHMEFQSVADGTMAFRIFEYGFRGAMLHGRESESTGEIRIQIPKPVIIFLRSGISKLHDKFRIVLDLPGDNNTAGYDCTVIYVSEYTAKQLIDKQLFPLIPFFALRYEDMIRKTNHTIQDEHDMNAQFVTLMHDLKAAADSNLLSGESAKQIKNYALNVYSNITAHPNANIINYEEVEKAMFDANETVEVTDYWGAMDRLREDVTVEVTARVTADVTEEVTARVTAKVTADSDARSAKSLINTTKKFNGTKEDAISSMITDMGFSEEKAMGFINELW